MKLTRRQLLSSLLVARFTTKALPTILQTVTHRSLDQTTLPGRVVNAELMNDLSIWRDIGGPSSSASFTVPPNTFKLGERILINVFGQTQFAGIVQRKTLTLNKGDGTEEIECIDELTFKGLPSANGEIT